MNPAAPLARILLVILSSLQFDAVEKGNAGIVTTGGTIETVIKDPLLSILKQDADKTQATRQGRCPCFDHDSTSPKFEFFMEYLIPHTKVCVLFLIPLLCCRRTFCTLLRQVFHLLITSFRTDEQQPNGNFFY